MFAIRNSLTLSFAALVAVSTPLVAEEHSTGRELAEQAFASISGSDRGWIDQGGFTGMGGAVFAAMDYDGDTKLTLSEFMVFDTGMRDIAETTGRLDSHDTALRVVFAFWDRNGDGLVSKSEHGRALSQDFQRADINDDARLEMDEFTNGVSIMVALRAAINPAPLEPIQ